MFCPQAQTKTNLKRVVITTMIAGRKFYEVRTTWERMKSAPRMCDFRAMSCLDAIFHLFTPMDGTEFWVIPLIWTSVRRACYRTNRTFWAKKSMWSQNKKWICRFCKLYNNFFFNEMPNLLVKSIVASLIALYSFATEDSPENLLTGLDWLNKL